MLQAGPSHHPSPSSTNTKMFLQESSPSQDRPISKKSISKLQCNPSLNCLISPQMMATTFLMIICILRFLLERATQLRDPLWIVQQKALILVVLHSFALEMIPEGYTTQL